MPDSNVRSALIQLAAVAEIKGARLSQLGTKMMDSFDDDAGYHVVQLEECIKDLNEAYIQWKSVRHLSGVISATMMASNKESTNGRPI